MNVDSDFSSLTSDGDTVELEDGRKLRLRIEPDPDSNINDSDCWGKVKWTRRDTDWSPARSRRPDGFSGRARIIATEFPDDCWWEPPSIEMVGCAWTDEEMRHEQAMIADLVRYGFNSIGLELLDGEDAYGRPIVVDANWLGSVEWNADNQYLAELLSQLVAELEIS